MHFTNIIALFGLVAGAVALADPVEATGASPIEGDRRPKGGSHPSNLNVIEEKY